MTLHIGAREQDMGQVMAEAQEGRDAAIWADWVAGMRQVDIAAKRGIPQQTVSDAVRRYAASIPPQAKDAYRERCLERLEALYQAHAQTALERPRVAAIVRGIIDSQARLLGLVQNQVQVQGQVDHVYVPGPTVEELLTRWVAEGRIRPRVTETLTRSGSAQVNGPGPADNKSAGRP